LHRKTRIVADRAATLEAQAGALRAGRSETHQETRSDGVYQVTTHYPPTAADLAQAAELEKQAAACRREANQLSAEADKVESVTIPALVNVGNAALRSGNLPAAARAFNEASRLDPDRTDVLKGQAEVATRQGNTRAAKAFTLLATPLEHSTAASKLQTAWNEIVRTASQNAGELLEAAAKIDPSEARVPAYRAIIAAGRGDAASAAKQRRAALALEEARARLMGTSFLAANAVPLRVEDVALTLAVRRQFAETLLTANNASAAVAACDLNTRIESRFDKFALTEFAPTALLPDTSEPNTIPDSPSLASLLAWSHLDAGRALLQLAKPDEALRHYRTVLAYNAGWPATAPGRETVKIPCGWAQLGLVEAAIAAKDFDTANRMVMDQNIVAWGLPRELEQRRKALQQQISDARQNQYQQQRDADARLTPRQMQARGLRDELARYQQQRDAIARELDRPGQNERTQQVLRSSIAELDRMIANDKARLGGLEQSP